MYIYAILAVYRLDCDIYAESVLAKASVHRIVPTQLESLTDKGTPVPVVCQQCEDAPYAAICPVEAITRDPDIDAVVVGSNLCVGCQMCIVACPFGALLLDRDRRQVIQCDLCDGADPWCVRFCGPGALAFEAPAASVDRRGRGEQV